MFDSVPDARAALADRFDPPRLERVVSALVPAIVLAPATGPAARGGTRIGGAPDLGPGAEWPRPAAPENPDAVAARGSPDAGAEMREHFAKNLPYAFFAQIDLGEAARLGPVASPLPDNGRLLFFYDLAAGPWESGSRVARVIWDTTPVERLETLAAPADLKEAADADRADRVKTAEEFEGDAEAARRGGSVYDAPPKAARLAATYRMAHPESYEFEARRDLAETFREPRRSLGENSFADVYREALREHHGSYPEENWRRQQLLGSPQPEQSDPRFDAVVATRFGKQHLEREEYGRLSGEVNAEASRDWLLLLQVDLADWMQAEFTEGTVYFLIRKDDLAARRFDRAVAIYQQT